MTNPGLKLFMEKLKRMIYSNNNPLISNHPSMLSKRPQFKLLYEELESTIQIISVNKGNDLHEFEDLRSLKKRFKDVADEAHDVVDLFVSVINFKIRRLPRISNFFEISLNLEDVMISIKSIKEDFIRILQTMKMELSPRTESLKTRSAAAGGTSCSRNSPAAADRDIDMVVGLDRDIDILRGKLVEDTKKLDVVSIVGMGGLGKTTLATKVLNDRFVVYHFGVRGWVTVSQTYEKMDLLNQILASMGVNVDPDKKDSYSHLREKLHKCLMGQRYLVIIDDIWNTQAWDDLKVVFPNHNNGSRLLLTSRNKKVALHAKSHGFIHQLRCLTDEESWELLHKKVFNGNDFPEWLTAIGMQIARNCHGLPLAVVVIAGVLAKEPETKDSWERISQSGSSLIVKGPMETLVLSFNYLPSHLRDCFLYLGGFPEDYRFRVTRLIWLWIAEGFIHEANNQSLEETAKDYLMELFDRNLIIVRDRKFDGAIKTFCVHDILRELCLEVATKERLLLKVQGSDHPIVAPYTIRRIFTDHYIDITNATRIRSLLFFYIYSHASYNISKCSHSWTLLMVLDLQQCPLIYFPKEISLLVSLRYLAIRNDDRDFQSTICDLRSLQTLIIKSSSYDILMLPFAISNLVNLRHLRSSRAIIFPPFQIPLMNLQTIYNVVLGDGLKSLLKYYPGVKKLSCFTYPDWKYDFKSLTFLEILKIRSMASKSISRFQKTIVRFPASMKKLTLHGCYLPWSCMSQIQFLPNLEVLTLLNDAFVGTLWDAGENPFQQLEFLKLVGLDIKQWEASTINFPSLKQLFLVDCHSLEGIPHEMRYIPTLEHINIKGCSSSVIESAYEIQEQQHADGNYDLKIISDRQPLRSLIDGDRALDIFIKSEVERGIYIGKSLQLLSNISMISGRRLSSYIINRTGTSINLLSPYELETLGLPVDHPLPAHRHIRRRRIWTDGRSKSNPKILNGGGRVRLFQYQR